MQTRLLLEQLTRNSERLAEAAGAAGVGAPVPTCPGWTVTDLLDHLVRGDDWAKRIVERGHEGITERTLPEAPPGQPDGEALVPFFLEGARALGRTLAAVDADTPVWTFSASDRTAAFWQRRRSQETAVHRFDAETAAGIPTPIDVALAVDGIDEFLTVFLPRLADNFGEVGDASVHLHCTDVDGDLNGEWLVARRDGELAVTPEHAKGDVAARGTASDLLLFLWGRIPTGSIEVFGDEALLGRVRDAIRV